MKHVAINFTSQLSTMFFDEATHALKKKLETPQPTRGWQHGANTWLGRLRWRTGVLSEKFLQLLGLLAIGLVLWLPVTVVLVGTNVSFLVLALTKIEDPFSEDYFPLYSNVLNYRSIQVTRFVLVLQLAPAFRTFCAR